MANTKVTQHVIADDAITTAMITDGNVTVAKLPSTVDLSSKTLTLPSAAVATTQSASDNSTKLATTAYVTTALANLVDSSPSDLNTLNELAAALNDDASFSSTVTTSIASKLPLAGGTLTGDLILGDNVKIEVGSASGGDLQIYHDGSNSYISDQGTGDLRVLASGLRILNNAENANIIRAFAGAEVELYHNGTEKLATSSYGVDIQGTGALKIPVGTTGQRPTAATGQLRFNSTEAKIEVYNGSAWVAVGAGASNKVLDTYTGDGSTTAFTLSVTPANEDALMVFIDGVYQEKGDYVLNNAILTLDTAPASGEKVAVHTTTASVHDGTSALTQQFTGDGSTTAFTLSQDPKSENNTQVYINGVYQEKTDYTVSGTTLTFSSAPANSAVIEVNMFTVATLGNSDTVTEGVSNLYHTTARAISALTDATLAGNLTLQDASSPTLRIKDTTQNVDLKLFAQDSNVGIGTFSNHDMKFYTNSAITLSLKSSGNVGVGTDNAGSKLTVEGDIRQTTGDLLYQGGGNWDIKHLADDQSILFYTSQSGSATEKLRIKANGNVGIGESSPSGKLHLSSANADHLYLERSGHDTFRIALSHSVGLGIYNVTDSRQDVMIDGSGRVKIGNTSGSGILNVDNGTTDGGYVHFANNVGSTTLTNDKGLAFGWNKSNGGGESVIIGNQGAGSTGGLRFATNTSGGSYAERMTITAGGLVGIGTTSPDSQAMLSLNLPSGTNGRILRLGRSAGSYYYHLGISSDSRFNIYNNDGTSELFSINTSGNVGIGASPNANYRNDGAATEKYLQVGAAAVLFADSGITTALANNCAINNSDQRIALSGTNPGSMYEQYQGIHVFYTTDSVAAGNAQTLTARFRISQNGDLAGTDTSISSISDERIKKNIADYSDGLNLIKNLKPRTFEFKDTTGIRKTGTQRGFIAQEVLEHDTYWISEEDATDIKDGEYEYTKDTEKRYLSKLNDKDAMYVSAIQEQQKLIEDLQTTINDLKSRIETLEG